MIKGEQLSFDKHGEITTPIERAIRRLQFFEPEDGYFVAFSGGKDSQCVYHLCQQAGVKFEAHYSVTSVDPPELIRFIREHYPDVKFDVPKDKDGRPITMWNLIPKNHMPPMRMNRYCCQVLKESNGQGKVVVTGVRWAESARRKAAHNIVSIKGQPKTTKKLADEYGVDYKVNKVGALILNDDNDPERQMVEHCYRTQKVMVNPIVDWTDEDVWHYLNDVVKVPHCSLYDGRGGKKRLGCIGCPMQGPKGMQNEFARWPKYKELYLRAFARMIEERKKTGMLEGKRDWSTPEKVMKIWIAGGKEE